VSSKMICSGICFDVIGAILSLILLPIMVPLVGLN